MACSLKLWHDLKFQFLSNAVQLIVQYTFECSRFEARWLLNSWRTLSIPWQKFALVTVLKAREITSITALVVYGTLAKNCTVSTK